MDKRERHKWAIDNRRQREKELRRKGILSAATKVFKKRGYQDTAMDDIALEAGITKPTIYQYFSSKEELFYSSLKPTFESLKEELSVLERKLKKKQFLDGREYIHSVFQLFYHVYQISPEAIRIINSIGENGEYRYLKEEYSSIIGKIGLTSLKSFMKNLKSAIKQGLILDYDTQLLTEILYGSFVGLMQTMTMTAQIGKGISIVDPASDLVKNKIQQLEKIMADVLVPKQRPSLKRSGG